MSLRAGPCLLTALLLYAGAAQAHNRSVSYSSWHPTDDGLRAELRLPTSELNPLGLDPGEAGTAAAIAQRVRDGFTPFDDSGACTPARAEGRRSGTLILVDASWRCAAAPRRLRSAFLLDRIPGHLHLLQWHADEAVHGPFALSAAQPQIVLAAAQAAPAAPAVDRYLVLGVEHILAGWDHLAFLVVLLLGAATVSQLAWRVSGFTVGHSLTLALATLGGVRPPAALIEAFIALTIACMAAERLLAGAPRARWHGAALAALLAFAGAATGVLPPALGAAAVLLTLGSGIDARLDGVRTGLFGLFHGFGFAGVLATFSAGEAVPVLPLLGFNLGVELGQLLFVVPLWWLAQRWRALRASLVPAAVLALGSALYLLRIA